MTATEHDLTADRLATISVAGQYEEKYRTAFTVRDLPQFYLDEPRRLGGTNQGVTPLENVLASLLGCSVMILRILQLEQKFEIHELSCDAQGVTDVRRSVMAKTGLKYSEIEPIARHFASVTAEFRVTTPESQERLEAFSHDVERLCPLVALLADAGVELTMRWVRVEPTA